MPINEKELNCNLIDQLNLLKRLERVAKKDSSLILEEIAFERECIEQKLYQNPALDKDKSK